jgi:hypothetical protein
MAISQKSSAIDKPPPPPKDSGSNAPLLQIDLFLLKMIPSHECKRFPSRYPLQIEIF